MIDYKSKDLNLALRKIGLKKDDNIFCHSNLGFFGRMKDINNKKLRVRRKKQ